MEVNKPFELVASQLAPSLKNDDIDELMSMDIDNNVNFIGQQRAQQALEFGLDMEMTGYNLFVMGEPATGRHTLIDNHLKEVAKLKSSPHEWLYVNNFDESREPVYIRMLPGESKKLVQDIELFIDELLDTFPAAFDNPSYQRKKRAIEREFNNKYEDALETVEAKALEHDVVLYEEKARSVSHL